MMLEDKIDSEKSIWNNDAVAIGVMASPVTTYTHIVVHEGAHALTAIAQGGNVDDFGIDGSYLWPSGAHMNTSNLAPEELIAVNVAGPLSSYALGLGLIIYGIKKKNRTAVLAGFAVAIDSTFYNLSSLSTLHTRRASGDMARIALFGGISGGALLGAVLAVSIPILALGIYGMLK